MNNLQWFDYLRIVVSLLALIAFLLSMRTANRQWSTYTKKHKDLWWALNAFLLLQIEGSIEQILGDVDYGPRTILSFIVACVCVRGQLRKGGYIKLD